MRDQHRSHTPALEDVPALRPLMKRSLEVLEQVAGCRLCDPRMVDGRHNIVLATPGKRYQPGGLAFWAEAPGEAEDEAYGGVVRPLNARLNKGRPNAGVIFDRLLERAGIDREELLVGNRVRCRPPRNRMGDYPEALTNCEPWNTLEFTVYDPAVVVVLGRYAMEPVYGANPKVGELRGTWRATGEKFGWGARLWFATYHPAAVLRNTDLFESVAEDFRQAAEAWKGLDRSAEI